MDCGGFTQADKGTFYSYREGHQTLKCENMPALTIVSFFNIFIHYAITVVCFLNLNIIYITAAVVTHKLKRREINICNFESLTFVYHWR